VAEIVFVMIDTPFHAYIKKEGPGYYPSPIFFR